MRPALHSAEWRAIQRICEDLSRVEGVVWAGATEAELAPRWLAFAGPDEQAPLEPDRDQAFHPLAGDCPPATALVVLAPPRPRRRYLCGILLPAGLTLVVVPSADDANGQAGAREALRAAMCRLRESLPQGQPPPRGVPPQSSSPPTPLSAWDWIPLPGSGSRRRAGGRE